MSAESRSPRVWKVFCRKGDGGPDFAEVAYIGGFVALGGNSAGPVGDAPNGSEFVRRYVSHYPDGKVRAQQVWKMHTEVAKGDWVCMPSSVTEMVHIGVVEDDSAYFEDGTDGCPFGHRRRVAWVGSVPPEDLERALGRRVVGRLTLNELQVPITALRAVAVAHAESIGPGASAPVLRDDAGLPVDASFELEFEDGQVTLVLRARGGSLASGVAVNSEYRKGLGLLVQRLGVLGAVLTDAMVETQTTSHLPPPQRRIGLGDLSYPQDLAGLADPESLVGALSRGQASIGRAEDARGAGNTTRRIRLYLQFPDGENLSVSGLEARLAYPYSKVDPDGEPTSDEKELDRRVERLLDRGDLPRPPGRMKPKRKEGGGSGGFERDPRVKAWVLQEAAGVCELCTLAAPFVGQNGRPYLEVHHPHRLADGGSDTIDNAVGICANCHRALHHSQDRVVRLDLLYNQVGRLVRASLGEAMPGGQEKERDSRTD